MSLLARAARSGRVHSGFGASAASSAAGFALTVTQAHTVPLAAFGAFAVATALYGLILGTVRACIAQPVLALPAVRPEAGIATGRATLAGLVIAGPTLAIALVLDFQYLALMAVALPGLLVYDTIRTLRLGVIGPRAGLFQDLAWALATVLFCALSLTGLAPGFLAYAGWAISGSVIGCFIALRAHYSFRPLWRRSAVPTSTSIAFGADYLVGGGATVLTTNLLSAFAGSSVVAAIRGAGTIFGPVNLFVGNLPTLLIPSLRSLHDLSPAPLRTAARITALLLGLSLIPLLALAFFPGSWGALLLGDVWPLAQPLLPWLALDLLASVVSLVPFTGHRSLLAGRASLTLRVVIALARCTFVVWAGVTAGAVAACAAMAAISVIAGLAWWASYFRQMRVRAHGQCSDRR